MLSLIFDENFIARFVEMPALADIRLMLKNSA